MREPRVASRAMRRLLRHRPSPAMVVACTALAVALGGTGYAAIKLPRNSVGVTQLRANSVTSGKVRNGSLTARDFRKSSLPRGPRGPEGPQGASAPGAIPRVAYASRDPFPAGPPVDVGATNVDLVALTVPAGTGGYQSSSGPIVASGPSRLIANGQAVILNSAAAAGSANVGCRLVLATADARVIGDPLNANIPSPNGYVPVAVSGGTDVDAGTYDVHLQCQSDAPGMQFHRGNLTVAIAPR